jgi:tRNA (guanine37-N1)-methyltransferase
MIFHILTIFPEMFQGFLNESILKKAQGKGLIEIHLHNIRDYSKDKHRKVDDTPYGGGAGMVFTPQPLFDCIEHVKTLAPDTPVIYLTPKGMRLTQPRAEQLTRQHKALMLLCGHYEGIDQRVIDSLVDVEVSIGDYVMSGGELGAMVMIDVLSRLQPGVLGNIESHAEDSFSKKLDRKKEYPHYTKPSEFRGMRVPDVLLGGHHSEIEKWRRQHLK